MEHVYGYTQIFTFVFRDFPRYLIMTILLVVSSACEGTVPARFLPLDYRIQHLATPTKWHWNKPPFLSLLLISSLSLTSSGV